MIWIADRWAVGTVFETQVSKINGLMVGAVQT